MKVFWEWEVGWRDRGHFGLESECVVMGGIERFVKGDDAICMTILANIGLS